MASAPEALELRQSLPKVPLKEGKQAQRCWTACLGREAGVTAQLPSMVTQPLSPGGCLGPRGLQHPVPGMSGLRGPVASISTPGSGS